MFTIFRLSLFILPLVLHTAVPKFASAKGLDKSPALKPAAAPGCDWRDCSQGYEVIADSFPINDKFSVPKGTWFSEGSNGLNHMRLKNGFIFLNSQFAVNGPSKQRTIYDQTELLPKGIPKFGFPKSDTILPLCAGLPKAKFRANKAVYFPDKACVRRGTLAEDLPIPIFPGAIAKAGDEIEIHSQEVKYPEEEVENKMPDALKAITLAKNHTFGKIEVPAGSKVSFRRSGRIESVTPPDTWKVQGKTIPARSRVLFSDEAKPILEPIPIEKYIDHTKYTGYQCPQDHDDLTRDFGYGGCQATIIRNTKYDGIDLSEGCIVYSKPSGETRGFSCPQAITFGGRSYKANSRFDFETGSGDTTACATGQAPNLKNAILASDYCLSFDKNREIDQILVNDWLTVGARTYWGPVKFNVLQNEIQQAPVYYPRPNRLESPAKFEEAYYPFCAEDEETVSGTKRFVSCTYQMNKEDPELFLNKVLKTDSKQWHIQPIKIELGGEIDDIEPSFPADTKDLITPVTIELPDGTELPTPILVEKNQDPHDRVFYMDDKFIYLLGNTKACSDYERYSKIEIPKGVKIKPGRLKFKVRAPLREDADCSDDC